MTLWDAIDRLENGRKWGRCSLYLRSDGARCMLGAIVNADENTDYDEVARYSEEVAAVATVIKEQFSDLVINPVNMSLDTLANEDVVWRFNDNERTTYEDVRTVMEKAAISRDEILS